MSDETPKLHIDSDWKAQAQAEKERLAEKEAARASQPGQGGEGEMPPASFQTLVATLASQAMMGLGAYGDPQTGRVVIDLVGAQFAIDLLGVVEEKTRGNLDPEEAKELSEVLAHLRTRFVQIAKLVAAQMQREGGGMPSAMADPGVIGSIGGAASASIPSERPASKSGLIMPD
jgi:hypothetical protein